MSAGKERFLVTGALGCIGSWVLKTLVAEGTDVVAFDIASHATRLDYVLEADERVAVTFVVGDITDGKAFARVLAEHEVTRIVHLAGLQVPLCAADPVRGALVNVLGTVNVFEAVKAQGDCLGLVYASSAAIYAGGDAPGDGRPVPALAPAQPSTHYGVYKQANEGTARVYWTQDGVPSIGLRPYVVYGVGRDQGLTSDPTKAMLAAALGVPFHIGYGGRSHFQFAPDVASAFIAAARSDHEGAPVLNLRGSVVDMPDVVAAIEAAEASSVGAITFEQTALPFPGEFESGDLEEIIGPVPHTELAHGVAQTIDAFHRLADAGLLDPGTLARRPRAGTGAGSARSSGLSESATAADQSRNFERNHMD